MIIIKDKASLSVAINHAVYDYNNSRTKLHEVAVSCMYHAKVYGDTRLLERLIVEMGKRSQTRHRIAAWVREFSKYEQDGKSKLALVANINKDGTVRVVVGKEDVREHIDIDGAMARPYWDTVDIQHTKAPFELDKAILSLVKRAAKEKGLEPEQALAEIQEAIKSVKVA